MKTKLEIEERLNSLQARFNTFSHTMSEHEKGELLGQIHALQWALEKTKLFF
jgi:hypothetical protein